MLTATGSHRPGVTVVAAGSGGFDVFARLERSAATRGDAPGRVRDVETPDIVFARRRAGAQPAPCIRARKLFRIDDDGRLQPMP